MFAGRVGRLSATAANPSLVAVSCPSSSRYHRTRARNLTRLPAPLAVALHRTVGGLVCSIAASPSLRRLGLHRPGGDGTRPWRGSDDTLSARTALRRTQRGRRLGLQRLPVVEDLEYVRAVGEPKSLPESSLRHGGNHERRSLLAHSAIPTATRYGLAATPKDNRSDRASLQFALRILRLDTLHYALVRMCRILFLLLFV